MIIYKMKKGSKTPIYSKNSLNIKRCRMSSKIGFSCNFGEIKIPYDKRIKISNVYKMGVFAYPPKRWNKGIVIWC